MLTVYHNGECSKCKELSELLQGRKVQYKFYLHEPLSVEELQTLLTKLGATATDIVRTGEQLFAANYAGKQLSDYELLQAIVDNPILLQRPIVVNGGKAIIARPPQLVKDIL
ncbi:MAG TPA: ArsC/Spx/MgsR family protein [Flavipsychrobacter sp.]|nr:ArsC/Spx/MgsR family protein [Flavipsychrobacter sp.]